MFAVTTVLMLALGIGANTAIFSVINAVLLKPTPFRDIDRLALAWETDRASATAREPASVPDFLDYRARSHSFEAIAAVTAAEMNFTPDSGDPAHLAALAITANTTRMLGTAPVEGRSFTEEEDAPGGPAVIMISQSLANRLFGGRSAVGQTVRLDDKLVTIVGVMPDGADFGVLQILSAAADSRGFADRGEATRVDLWVPLGPDPKVLPRETHPIFMIGRLAPGASVFTAQNELSTIAKDLERTYQVNRDRGIHVEALGDVVLKPIRPALLILLTAVALVLLVACANVANLLLARGSSRGAEIAMRKALGATNARLLRQFAVEGLLLTLPGCAVGAGLAYGGLQTLIAWAPAGIPRLSQATIDAPVLSAAIVLSIAIAIPFALIPAFQGTDDLQAALAASGGARGTAGRQQTRLRAVLLTAELAIAVVLLSAAALLIRSFNNVLQTDAGFNTEGVVKAEYQLPLDRYPVDMRQWPNLPEQHAFVGAVLERISSLPGVVASAIAGNHPLDPGFTNSFRIVGREAERWPEISVRRVTYGYFRAVGLPIVGGRLFDTRDGTDQPPVALLNEAAARRIFGARNPLGSQIQFWGFARTIVGIVADERIHGLAEPAPICLYVPFAQAPSTNGAGVLLVRSRGNLDALATSIRAVMREQDPRLAAFGLEPLSSAVSRSVAERRFVMMLLALFAATALLLGAVGIHGLLSYQIALGRKEIGIRMALGASAAEIAGQVLRQVLAPVVVGVVVGLICAVASGRLIAAQLYGVAARDPLTLALVAGLLLVVSVAACLLPARRATRVDPVVTLRME